MPPASLTIRILQGIRKDLRKNTEELRTTNVRLENLERYTVEGFAGLSDRIDGVSDRVDGLSDRVDGLSNRVDGLSDGIDRLEKSSIAGFVGVTARLENIRDIAGEGWRDHEARLQAVETALAAAKRPARR